MDPFLVWLTAAVVTLGTFTGWLVRTFIAHLESDLAYSRKTSHRGADVAERATTKAEESA